MDYEFNDTNFDDADEVIEYKLEQINKKIAESMDRSVMHKVAVS